MTAFYVDTKGNRHDVPVTIDLLKEAKDAGLTLGQLINTKYSDPDALPDSKKGTVFQQVCASVGLVTVGENPFGQRSPILADIFEGKSGYSVAANTQQRAEPLGTESRLLFPAAVIAMTEDRIQPDRITDNKVFRSMVAHNESISSDMFQQPVVSYQSPGGAHTGLSAARAQRITEMGNTPMMLSLTTSDRAKTLPTYGIGIEVSDKALVGTTLDRLVMVVSRFTEIEHDQRVNSYLSALFNGDVDSIGGAVPVIESKTLDPESINGELTHTAWVKWLARKRKLRRVTHVIGDIDTYLKWERRKGRPGENPHDPTRSRIDPQAKIANMNNIDGDVVWFIVDTPEEGGPVPKDTIWALDKKNAIMMVKNLFADFKATQEFVLQRKSAMVWHWGEDCFRLWGDDELTPFDALHLSAS